LQKGDVITHFNGEPVTRSVELQRLVSRASIGSNAQLKVLRNGQNITVATKLQELKEATQSTPTAPNFEGTTAETLGLRVTPVTPQLSQRFGVRDSKGVVVVGVQPGSAAAQYGVQVGDVIERVGQTAVTTPQALETEVKSIFAKQSAAEKNVALYVNRQGQRRYLSITVGSTP
jgi:serine protease Do